MYIMLITYSFDTDYVSVPCETEQEAIKKMEEYLENEIEVTADECGYRPTVVDTETVTEKILVYESELDEPMRYKLYDHAIYKVIDVNHNYEGRMNL